MKIRVFLLLISAITALVIGGCGGGGGGGGGGSSTTVSGVVFKGPVSGSTVAVYAIRNGAVDRTTPLGVFSPTPASGAYSINIGTYSGPVLVEALGGTYLDEATGASGDISGLAGGLQVFVADASGAVSANPTALTKMAANDIFLAATIDAATINRHNTEVGNLFGVSDIVGTVPVNAAAATPAGASQAQIDYGLALAAVSKYLQLHPGVTFGTALTTLGADTPTNQTLVDLAAARTAFISAPENKSGVTGNTAATSITLKLSTAGTLAVANSIGGIQVTINLPPGVSIANIGGDASSALSASLLTTGATIGAGFVDAVAGQPATVKIVVTKTSGFGIGEFATVTLTKTAGSVVTPAHLILTGFKAVNGVIDANGNLGNALSGVTPAFTATFQ